MNLLETTQSVRNDGYRPVVCYTVRWRAASSAREKAEGSMNGFSDDDIRWLLGLLEEQQLAEIEVESGESSIAVKAPTTNQQPPNYPPATVLDPATAVPEELSDHIVPLLAPIAGTFYRMPSPDADSFVDVGDIVAVGDTVGLVEAMKLYHDVSSPVRGRITLISVENQEQVDAEQRLMLIDRNV